MAEQLIISISGMRGIVGENLTGSIGAEYGCAFGTFLESSLGSRQAGKKQKLSVCIGRDTRPSGQMLKSAVTAGLCAVGVDVIDLGVVTTPGVSIMAREIGCSGAVCMRDFRLRTGGGSDRLHLWNWCFFQPEFDVEQQSW